MKKLGLSVLLLMAGTLVFVSCASKKAPETKGNWKLVWNDEFNGSKIDETKWGFQLGTGSQYGLDGWGNNELQYYTKENAFVKKGNLVIEARKEAKGGMAYTSSRLRTMTEDEQILYAPTFGKIEARIQAPSGNGIWPAFWMLPATDKYGVWAASGEIDIMEIKGRLPNRTYGTVHYGQAWPGQKESGSMYKFPEDEDTTDFHVYSLEWEPGVLRWLVDDNVYYETSSWYGMDSEGNEFDYPAPFDVPFYIVLNLAVGGIFDDYRVPDANDIPAQMLVDYVRVYEKMDGYNYDVKRPVPPQDTAAFEIYRKSEDGNFIQDMKFATATSDGLYENSMDVRSSNWYFLNLSDFGGKAVSKVEDDAFHIEIINEGGEVHSVQLLQHLGIAKGYTYEITFEAKAKSERNISVKLGGDDDNKWAVYSSQYSPKLTEEYKAFKYRFTMEGESDPSARLEFNVGKNSQDVWIRNVAVKALY